MNEFATTRATPAPAAVAERVSAFLRAVYGWMCAVVGVIVFTGLTAGDAQRLKHVAAELPEGRLFLILLRFTGGRRN